MIRKLLTALFLGVVWGMPLVVFAQDTSDPALPNQILNVAGLTLLAVASFGAGGFTIALLIDRIRNDRPLMDAIEQLGKSAPPEVISTIHDIAKLVKDTSDLIIRVTDGLPNQVPPSEDEFLNK